MKISREAYYSILLVVFLWISLVGILPFAPRVRIAPGATGAGSILRQIVFLGIFAAAVLPFAFRYPLRVFNSVPIVLWLLFAWCAITLAWSPVPGIGIRRLGLTMIVAITGISIVSQLSFARSFDVLAKTLIGFTLLGLLTGILFPSGAIHQVGDPENLVIGNWRGIFFHKNIAGLVAVFAIMFAMSFVARRRNFKNMSVLLLCFVMLLLTGSKTSIGLLLIVLVAKWIMGFAVVRNGGKFPRAIYLLVPFVFVVLAITMSAPQLSVLLENPALFTGRTQVWGEVSQLFLRNPFFGVGFGSIYKIGTDSALAEISNANWVASAAHGHNGYLDIATSIGLVGLALSLWFLLIHTWNSLRQLSPDLLEKYGLTMFSCLAICLLHNLLETGFLERSKASWVIFLIVIGMLFSHAKQKFGKESEQVSPATVPATGMVGK